MKNIIITKQGVWKFYHDEILGICFYSPQSDTPMILFQKGAKDFNAVCDNDGLIYLLTQDDRNNIYLFYYDKTNWRKQCLFEAKSAVPYDKNFTLVAKNGWINAFYTIKHSEKTLLIHHILNNETEPEVIESFDNPTLFTVTTDINDNIYCAYQKESIGFKVFKWKEKEWQSFSPIQKLRGEVSFISAICDLGNSIHIVCSTRERNEHTIYYLSRNGTEKIYDGFMNTPEPIILYSDKFYILFKVGGRLMQSISENPELGFLKPSYYFPGSFTPHYLFSLSCSADLKLNKLFVEKIYGAEPHSNLFEAAIIQKELDNIDFSAPEILQEVTPEIENYVNISEPFQNE